MSRIRTNTMALGLSFFVTAFFFFIQLKIITVNLSQEAVGIWAALLAMGALLGTLTEMGLPQVIVRYAAKFDAEGRLARVRPLLFFALRTHYGAVLAMSLLLGFVGTTLWHLFSQEPIGWRLVLLGYLVPASGTLRAVNNASFRGLRRMGWVAGLEILFSVSVTVGYYLLRHRLDVRLILLVFFLASLAVGIIGLFVSLRLLGRLPVAEADRHRPVLPEIRGYWQGAAAAGIFLIAIEWLDKLLLAGLATMQAVAIFQVVSRLALFPRRLLAVPMQVLNPEITHKWEGGRRAELAADMALFIKLQLGLGLLLITPLTLFAKPLLLLVSTREFLPGASALWVFTGVIPLLCLHQPLVLFLRAIGHVWLAFIADASWLGIYLGLGSLLVRRFGLAGFVAGQAVASTAVLLYTFRVFGMRGLPAPPASFFLRRVALSGVIWGGSVAVGSVMPPDLPLGLLILLGLIVVVLANFLMVLGRFLSPDEEARAVALLAGRGRIGKVAGFLFAWPRRITGRTLGPALLAVALLGSLGACAEPDVPCRVDGDVPRGVRRGMEKAANAFFDQVRAEDAPGIYRDAATMVHQKFQPEEFVTPIAQSVTQFGLADTLALTRIYYVNLAPGMAVEFPIKCFDSEESGIDKLNLLREPVQGSMVHTGRSHGEEIQYSTLWFREGKTWKVSAFYAKPYTILGRTADEWAAVAEEQREAGHLRNTALLYNLVLDLHVPNPWTEPAGVDAYQARQRSIAVSHLPADRLDLWEAPSDTFRVYSVGYRYLPGHLDVMVSRETDRAFVDSLEIYEVSDRLDRYVEKEFPEYAEVFGRLLVRATPPGRSDLPGLIRAYPLRKSP